jgi:hypothetical protein
MTFAHLPGADGQLVAHAVTCDQMGRMGNGSTNSAVLLLTSGEAKGSVGNIENLGLLRRKKNGFFLFSR